LTLAKSVLESFRSPQLQPKKTINMTDTNLSPSNKFYLSRKDLLDFFYSQEINAKPPRKNAKDNLVISMVGQWMLIKPPVDSIYEVQHYTSD